VVGTAHKFSICRLTNREDFVPAVAAGVHERMQHTIGISRQQHVPRAHRDRVLVTRSVDELTAPDAHPGAVEEVLVLPCEDRR